MFVGFSVSVRSTTDVCLDGFKYLCQFRCEHILMSVSVCSNSYVSFAVTLMFISLQTNNRGSFRARKYLVIIGTSRNVCGLLVSVSEQDGSFVSFGTSKYLCQFRYQKVPMSVSVQEDTYVSFGTGKYSSKLFIVLYNPIVIHLQLFTKLHIILYGFRWFTVPNITNT